MRGVACVDYSFNVLWCEWLNSEEKCDEKDHRRRCIRLLYAARHSVEVDNRPEGSDSHLHRVVIRQEAVASRAVSVFYTGLGRSEKTADARLESVRSEAT